MAASLTPGYIGSCRKQRDLVRQWSFICPLPCDQPGYISKCVCVWMPHVAVAPCTKSTSLCREEQMDLEEHHLGTR